MSPENWKSSLVPRAHELAQKCHEGQFRKSGEPYFDHCLAVANIISEEWGIKDDNFRIAALLHDTVEDSNLTLDEIRSQFGPEVGQLVDGVTKLNTGNDKDTLAKVLKETYINPGVAVLKLADRLHNMRTLSSMPPEKQRTKSQETLDVYAKLAESLGMWEVKTELEDLSFQYLAPPFYQKTKEQVDADPRLTSLFLSHVQSQLNLLLSDNSFNNFQVDIRQNGYWNLKHKQKKDAMIGKCNPDSFFDINDLVSFRVQLPTIKDCYSFLRILHENLGHLVDYDRYDEFIGANKRLNGYQAIQTTLNFSQGPVEIAIMTPKMEEFNNTGVVSLIKNHHKNLDKYTLKLIFTPDSSIKFLPRHATGVDFAAVVNPQLLANAETMEVDGFTTNLSSILPQASTVRIITSDINRRAPPKGVEEFCALPETRKIILKQRMFEKRDNLINQGRSIMETILAPRGLLDIADIGDRINPVLYNFGCQGLEEFYTLVGNGSITPDELNRELDNAQITKDHLAFTSIKLVGVDGPGILIDIITTISQMGKNIININQENKNSHFNLRLMVKDLEPQHENQLRQIFENDPRFNLVKVV